LDRRGLREETLVLFTSDNGPVTTDWRHWWEVNLYGDTGGFRGRKADLYEGGIRVPALVRWPGRVPAGRVSDAVVSGVDLLPTLASVVGFPVPADRPIDGEDVSGLLRGEPFARRRPLYWEFDDDQGFHYALREGSWKLLADRTLARVRLYDLAADRFELTDLAETRKDVVEALLLKVKDLHASVDGDPLRPRRNR
jgi:arylsulfatase A-like enzyme